MSLVLLDLRYLAVLHRSFDVPFCHWRLITQATCKIPHIFCGIMVLSYGEAMEIPDEALELHLHRNSVAVAGLEIFSLRERTEAVLIR